MASTISFARDTISVVERDGFVVITILRSGDLSGAASVTVGITEETATDGLDYVGAPVFDTVQFQPGEEFATLTRRILDDDLPELTETFVVSLISAEGEGVSLTAPRTLRVDILDDENPVTEPVDPPLVSPYDVTLTDLVSGLTTPIAFEFLPNDPNTLFIAGKDGVVGAYDATALASGGAPVFQSTLLDLRSVVNDRQDRGLMDIAIHPDIENSPYLYVFYVVDPPGSENRTGNPGPDGGGNRFSHLVRYTLDADVGYTAIVPDSGAIIVGGGARTFDDISGSGIADFTNPDFADRLASDIDVPRTSTGVALEAYDVGDPPFVRDMLKVDSKSHAGGALAFGPDGALYVSVGDGTSYNYADPRSFYVQDPDSLAGKILRIDPITGLGLPDNPFVEPGDLGANASRVWQLGLRNPFTMAFDDRGRLFLSEVGWAKWEEINTGGAGANFGWPYYEGGDNGVSSLNAAYNSDPRVVDGTFMAPPESAVTAPFRAFSHARKDPGFQVQAIVGAEFLSSGDLYPASLDGYYIFSDFSSGSIFAIDPDDRREVVFLANRGNLAPVRHEQGPDGYLYFVDIAFGNFGRIEIEIPLPTLNIIAPADVAEGDAGQTGSLVFSVVLSEPAGPGGVTADVSVSGGGAVTPPRLIIAEGATGATISVEVVGDDIAEPNETVTVTLSNLVNATAGALSASARILDDDGGGGGMSLLPLGAASYDADGDTFVLTTATRYQTGGAATEQRIDLGEAARITFEAFFGSDDAGADGLGLALHADPRGAGALGSGGGGIGLSGLANAVGIRFDTHSSGSEPASDYTAIFDPDGAFRTAPVTLANLEDGVWRNVEVIWDPSDALRYRLDGVEVGALGAATVTELFGGADYGHVLFGAATGARRNVQSIRNVDIDATWEGGGTADADLLL